MTVQLKRRSLMRLMGMAPAYFLLPVRRLAATWGDVQPGNNVPQAVSQAAPQTAGSTAKTYRCPPCGLDCDKLLFDKPGDCPKCGMKLIPAEGAEDAPPSVAMLVFNGVQIIDIAGPWEVFGTAGFLVHTVAEKSEPVTTVFDQKLIPDFTFENGPKAQILVIPGGGYGGPMNNSRVIEWIQTKAKDVDHVMSVCTGALILAKTGLLEGLTATTTFGMIDQLIPFKANVVHDKRFVDSGKIITTAGLTAGIDGALHLVSVMLGRGPAESVALSMEYDWDPDSKYARAALADRYLRQGLGIERGRVNGVKAKLVSTTGDTTHWKAEFLVSEPNSPDQILNAVRETLSSDIPYLRGNSVKLMPASGKGNFVKWTFVDDERHGWQGTASTEPVKNPDGKFLLSLNIRRS